MGQQESRIGHSSRLQARSTDGAAAAAESRATRRKHKIALARDKASPKVIDALGERSPLLPTAIQQIDEDISAVFTAAARARTVSTHNRVNSGQEVTQEVRDELKKEDRMSQRNFKLHAITGAIGTGLFLALGRALQIGGPAGALIGYAVVGLVVGAVQHALGEVGTLYPVKGAYITHTEMLFDDSLGFAVSWNSIYGHMISVPCQITAILVLLQTFTTNCVFVFTTIMVVIAAVTACLKVQRVWSLNHSAYNRFFLVIAISILAFVLDVGWVPGVKAYKFRYWHNPGPFVDYLASENWGKFVGCWAVLNIAIFSFAGVEDLTIAASETKHPRQNIPNACDRTLPRIVFFFLLTVLLVGLLVPSNDPNLNGTRAKSPFVIVADRLGYGRISSFVNLLIICAAWSSATTSIFNGLNILNGKADQSEELRNTIYYAGVLVQVALAATSFVALWIGPLKAFYHFVNLVASETVVSWIVILLNHIRLRQACIKQVVPREHLPWHRWWTTYSSYLAVVACLIFLFTGGFTVFFDDHWDTWTFITSYIEIVIFLGLYVGRECAEETIAVPLDEIPIREILEDIEKHPEEALPPLRFWEKINPFCS